MTPDERRERPFGARFRDPHNPIERMQLPGCERAVVDPAKLRDYLLSPEHPVGRTKARFFARMGFARSDWPALQTALLAIACDGDAVEGSSNEYGRKYEVGATIQGSAGRPAGILTVWIVLDGEDFPRFVTAYPWSFE